MRRPVLRISSFPLVWRLAPFAIAMTLAGPPAADAQAPGGKARVSIVLALDGGVQNIIGGAQVSGLDVLSQASRRVGTLSLGVRAETSFGFVVGADLGFGVADGNLRLVDPDGPLEVSYRNRTQRHWNAVVGWAVGAERATTLHVYLSEVSRTFDVDVNEAGARYRQIDGQGLLRFGLGVERDVTKALAVRLRAGTSRADFGGRPTNITPARPLDLTAGVVLRPGGG